MKKLLIFLVFIIFSNLSSVKLINLTESGCKGKLTLGDYRGIVLTKCFAEKNNNIIPYLEEIF